MTRPKAINRKKLVAFVLSIISKGVGGQDEAADA